MKVLLLILTLAFSVSAQKVKEGQSITQWEFVAEGPLVKSYYSQSSIKRSEIIKVWMRFELPEGSRQLYPDTPIDFGEIRIYELLNCAENRSQTKTMLVYDRSGVFYMAEENVGEWKEENENSIGHAVFSYFCERGEKPTKAPTLKPK